MKKNNPIFKIIISIILVCFINAGCKKKEEPAPEPPIVTPIDYTAQQFLRAADQSNVQNESTQANG